MPLSPELLQKRERLLFTIQEYGPCIVALSAGVDSAVVAKAAHLALGDQALAVTGSSASLAEGELEQARELAALIGIRHRVIDTQEFSQTAYTQNAPDRCYHCKTELYTRLESICREIAIGTVLNGANVDDQGDYRPGMFAATENRVRSPLIECEITKSDVRQLAADWSLPVWDKPATPCLSSRVAYGEQVTPQKLHMIDRAEQRLRALGLKELRVRYHSGDLARIEVPVSTLQRLCDPAVREELLQAFRDLGFKYVTLDLEGFRSGSLNAALVQIEPRPRP